MTDTSRSPYRISASVRGMGVADMTRVWGCSPLAARAARCPTPKRCCSSVTTSPRSAYSTPPVMRAWVPMAKSISPAASWAQMERLAAAFVDPVSRAQRMPRFSISGANPL